MKTGINSWGERVMQVVRYARARRSHPLVQILRRADTRQGSDGKNRLSLAARRSDFESEAIPERSLASPQPFDCQRSGSSHANDITSYLVN